MAREGSSKDGAARMRAHRELFAFALARNLSLDAARRELARERWSAIDARLASRRCGTRVSAPEEAEGRALQWWQK